MTEVISNPKTAAKPSAASATEIELVQAAIDSATQELDTWISNIEVDELTALGLHERIQRFNVTPASQGIDDALTIATNYRDDAQAGVQRAVRELIREGDTAEELRNQRYWERTRRALDVVPDDKLAQATARLVESTTDSELGVLLQEVRHYFDSRGPIEHASFDQAVKRRAPSYAEAIDRATTAEKAYQVTRYNAEALRNTIDKLRHPKAYRRPQIVDARTVATPKRRSHT